MLLHLIFAIFWFLVALAVLILPQVDPDSRVWTIINVRMAIWVSLFLTVYFTLRWWTTRPRMPTTRGPEPRRRSGDEPAEPIPEFMFDTPTETEPPRPPGIEKPRGNGQAGSDH